MKIHLLSCFHLRPEITKIFLEGVKRNQSEFDIDYTFVVSDEENKAVLTEYGYNYVEYQNLPVSNKFNFGLSVAMKKDFDYLLIMGSDNLISNEGIRLMLDNSRSYKGFRDIWFYNTIHKKWAYYKQEKKRLVGAGRMISKEALENVMRRGVTSYRKPHNLCGINVGKGENIDFPLSCAKYLLDIGYVDKPFEMNSGLWGEGLNKSLDHSSEMNLAYRGYSPYEIVSDKCHLVDIKSYVNITQWVNLLKTAKKGDFDMWFLSEKEKEMISLI